MATYLGRAVPSNVIRKEPDGERLFFPSFKDTVSSCLHSNIFTDGSEGFLKTPAASAKSLTVKLCSVTTPTTSTLRDGTETFHSLRNNSLRAISLACFALSTDTRKILPTFWIRVTAEYSLFRFTRDLKYIQRFALITFGPEINIERSSKVIRISPDSSLSD